MANLYRQYRPQTFAEIVGQDHITKTLQQAIIKNRISHAYLFQGPRGTGKTTTARLLAKRLNCVKAKGAEPCGKCDLCLATGQGKNIDVIEIDAASNRGIDDIRALRESVALSPAMGRYKIYIIDEVHMLTNEAFAALLKTLEEPAAHAIFILATTELQKVPATILSRCQVYRFKRASEAEMRQRLEWLLKQESRQAEDEVINFIIARSDGCYRDAESLLGQLMTVQSGKIQLEAATELLGLPAPQAVSDFLLALVDNDIRQAVSIAERLHDTGIDPEQFIRETIRTARDGCLAAYREEKELPAFAARPQSLARLPVIIRAFIQAGQDLAYVPQPLIALELAILTSVTTPKSERSKQPLPASNPRPTAEKEKVVSTTAANSAISVSDLIKAWPALIDKVRAKNPVASTFLRAIEPAQVEDGVVKLKVQFPLHLNFFAKPEAKKIVDESLSQITGKKLSVAFNLENQGAASPRSTDFGKAKEEELLKNVQELFGTK